MRLTTAIQSTTNTNNQRASNEPVTRISIASARQKTYLPRKEHTGSETTDDDTITSRWRDITMTEILILALNNGIYHLTHGTRRRRKLRAEMTISAFMINFPPRRYSRIRTTKSLSDHEGRITQLDTGNHTIHDVNISQVRLNRQHTTYSIHQVCDPMTQPNTQKYSDGEVATVNGLFHQDP